MSKQNNSRSIEDLDRESQESNSHRSLKPQGSFTKQLPTKFENLESVKRRLKRNDQESDLIMNEEFKEPLIHSNEIRRQTSEPVYKVKGQKSSQKYHIKLKRINIQKVLKVINARVQAEKNVRELLNQIQQIYKLAQYQKKDTSGLFKQFLPRLRGAQLEGFEGVKKLNQKYNQKRKEQGQEEIDLETQCKEDLDKRLKDQEELFQHLLKLPLDENLSTFKNHYETRQIRLNNIKSAQFIVPSKEIMSEKISLSDSIPFLDEEQSTKRDHFMLQMKEKAKLQIQQHYSELQELIEKQNQKQWAENQGVKGKEMYDQTLKELAEFNAESIDYKSLAILLFITQNGISDLKNSKSKRLDNIKDLKVNPYELLHLLNNINRKPNQ